MRIEGIDERALARERHGADFLVFIYQSGNSTSTSWSVDSYLITDSALDGVLHWLRENLPVDSCWALGVVETRARPTAESDVEVAWIVGADVMNTQPRDRTADEQRVVTEMLARRHRVAFP